MRESNSHSNVMAACNSAMRGSSTCVQVHKESVRRIMHTKGKQGVCGGAQKVYANVRRSAQVRKGSKVSKASVEVRKRSMQMREGLRRCKKDLCKWEKSL